MIIKSTQDGQTIRVKDVARVEMGALSYSVESKNNGKPSVTMMVTQTAGSNATEIATNIKKAPQGSGGNNAAGNPLRHHAGRN